MMNRQSEAVVAFAIIFLSFVSTASAQTGDVTPVHDPSIIQSGNAFYVFSTGRGLSIRASTDLFNWKRDGRVFDQVPTWTQTYSPDSTYLWAPDISLVNGEYRLYYAVSSFGKTLSAIGLATNKTLDRSNPDYKWIDRGKVIETPAESNWNAIDPCAFEDAENKTWLVLGSCWQGIKLVSLNRQTGMRADSSETPLTLATHPPTNINEEGYIRRHGDFYYLWESFDRCCHGVNSTYRIVVGRSNNVRGPYLDFDGKPMSEGGGTLVLASYESVRGPGSCAIVRASDRDYLIHHEYDAANRGKPTLQIRELFYNEQGWPMVGEPLQRSPMESMPVKPSISASWNLRYDFGSIRNVMLQSDGSLSPDNGNWQLKGRTLTLSWKKAAKTLVEECIVSDDGSYFVGRNSDGMVVTATRADRQ